MHKSLLLAMLAMGIGTVNAADYTAPCTIPCDTQSAFDQWTVIDNNAATSPTTWTFRSSAAYYSYDSKSAADDWIISPSVRLKAGVTYGISAYMKTQNATSWKENFAIYVGENPTVEGLTEKIFSQTDVGSLLYDYYTGSFEPQTDGEYYVGIQCFSDANKYGLYFQELKIEAVVPYPGAANILSIDVAPEGVLEAEIRWEMPTVTNLGGPLTKLSGAKIYRGTTSTFTLSESTLIGTFNGGNPGEGCLWKDTTIPSAGQYYYAVVPFDANGDSPVAPTRMQSGWIGYDTSVSSISEVIASLVDGSDTTIKITWTSPIGTHGAPLEPGSLKYKIVRSGNITKDITLETEFDGTEYTDDTIEGLDTYTYTVTTVFNGSTAWTGTKSNSILAGGALTPPYSEDFNSSNALDLWSLFHGPKCTRDWWRYQNTLSYYAGGFADAWAVMPTMKLKADTPYEITFRTWVYTSSSPKDLYFYIGDEPTAESLEQKQLFFETINSGIPTVKRIVVSVPQDGQYYFAFRCYGNTDSNDIFVDDLTIKEIESSPDVVKDLTATVGAQGALEVTLDWTNPTLTNGGTALMEITKAEVLRNNSVIATLPDADASSAKARAAAELIPGEGTTYTDTSISAPGKYTYTVRLYLGENASEAVSVTTGWVGPDTPAAPATVTAVVEEDGSRTISFDSVTEGVNGGYIGNVHYVVTRNGVIIDDNVTESPYVDAEEVAFGKYYYGVTASNEDYTGAETMSETILFGGPFELPYNPDFSNADHMALWTLTGDRPNNTWQHESYYLRAYWASDNSWAFTPPLNIVHSELELSISAYATKYNESIEIYLSKSTDHTVAEHHTKIHTAEISSYTDHTSSTTFTVDNPGIYYIGYRIPTTNQEARINKTSLVATQILTGVEDVDVEAMPKLLYSAAFDRLEAPSGAVIAIYDAAGRYLSGGETHDGKFSTAMLPAGVYVGTATAADGSRLTVKFAK